jgi:hypothetical protein
VPAFNLCPSFGAQALQSKPAQVKGGFLQPVLPSLAPLRLWVNPVRGVPTEITDPGFSLSCSRDRRSRLTAGGRTGKIRCVKVLGTSKVPGT